MGRDNQTIGAFTDLARGTGGQCVVADRADAVITAMTDVLAREFGNLPFDREVLTAAQEIGDTDTARLAERLGSPRGPVAASLTRLGKRGFLEAFLPASQA
jgi:hypothetical protein